MQKLTPTSKQSGFLGAYFLISVSRAWAQVSNLILLLLAARVLSIEEFGAFSIASITVLILLQSADAGWYEYAADVATNEDVPPELFWCAIGAGVIAMLVILIIAFGIYVIVGSQLYALVLFIMSPLPLLGAMTAVQCGVHTRNGRVIMLPLSAIPAELAGLVVGVWALLEGYGVVSLALHKLVMMTVAMLIVTLRGGWIARFSVRPPQIRSILHFYWQWLLTRSISFTQNYGADYLIAILLNLTSVGLYRAANRIAGAVAELVSETVRIIGWNRLTQTASNTPQGRRSGATLDDLFSLLIIIAVPAFVGMALKAQDIATLLLGENWSSVGPLLIFLSLSKIILVMMPLLQPVMALCGEARQLPRQSLIFAGIALLCLVVIGHQGPVWAALSQLLAGLLMFPILMYFFVHWGGLSLTAIMPDAIKVAIATLAMVAAIFVSQFLLGMDSWDKWQRLAAAIAIGSGTYLALILLLKPSPISRRLARNHQNSRD